MAEFSQGMTRMGHGRRLNRTVQLCQVKETLVFLVLTVLVYSSNNASTEGATAQWNHLPQG
jgi:hypothetical protein